MQVFRLRSGGQALGGVGCAVEMVRGDVGRDGGGDEVTAGVALLEAAA